MGSPAKGRRPGLGLRKPNMTPEMCHAHPADYILFAEGIAGMIWGIGMLVGVWSWPFRKLLDPKKDS
jgi:hypothetical protein